MTDFIVTYGIYLAYFALVVATLAAIIFPLIQMFQDLKNAKTAFIGIGAVLVVFFLCYLLADEKSLTIGDVVASAGQMKMVEASLYSFYILLATSILAILYSTISRYFK